MSKRKKGTFKFAEMITCYRLSRTWVKEKKNFILIAKIMDSQERVLRYGKTSNHK